MLNSTALPAYLSIYHVLEDEMVDKIYYLTRNAKIILNKPNHGYNTIIEI